MRHGRVPRKVVARTQLHRVITLGHPPATRQHHVVLVAVVGVDAGGVAGLDRDLQQADVAARPRVDLGDPGTVGRGRGALGRTDDARALAEKLARDFPDNRLLRSFVDDKRLDRMLADPAFKELAL